MARDAADLGRRIVRAGRHLTVVVPSGNMAAAEVFKQAIEAEFARNGLPVGANLAGSPWKGVLLKRVGDGVEVKAANPAHFFNNRTAPHLIVAKGFGGSRRSRAAALGGLASRTVTVANEDGSRGRYTLRAQTPIGPLTGAGGRLGRLRATRDSRSGKRALTVPGRGYRAYVRHPGTRGRPSFGAGTRKGRQKAAEAMMAEHRREMMWQFLR